MPELQETYFKVIVRWILDTQKPIGNEINTISFTITPKKTRYFGINLTKHVQDLYAENYQMEKKL